VSSGRILENQRGEVVATLTSVSMISKRSALGRPDLDSESVLEAEFERAWRGSGGGAAAIAAAPPSRRYCSKSFS
jgi:hypothetical protein